MDRLKKWVDSAINNSYEDECWKNVPQELISILEPIRKKLLKNEEEISNLKEKLKDKDESLDFYLAAINSLPNPIFIKDDSSRFVFFNDKYRDVFGMDKEKYIGKTVLELDYLSDEDRKKYHDEDMSLIQNSSIVHYEVPFLFSDGQVHDSFYWSKGFEIDKTGKKGLVGEIVDISIEKNLEIELSRSLIKLQEMNEMIEKYSIIDPTTKLYNRYMLNNKVPGVLEDAEKTMSSLCFLLADLDHFKSVNDVYGHVVGDEILARFSEILKNNFRDEDICIRYGGEEFLVVMPYIDIEEAEYLGERLCEKTREGLRLPNGNTITVSVGITSFDYGETLSRFLSRVDKALYMSKDSGRDRVTII